INAEPLAHPRVMSVGAYQELGPDGEPLFDDRFPVRDDVAHGGSFQHLHRDHNCILLALNPVEAMVPLDFYAARFSKPFFEGFFQVALRHDQQEWISSAEFSELELGATLRSVVESNR